MTRRWRRRLVVCGSGNNNVLASRLFGSLPYPVYSAARQRLWYVWDNSLISPPHQNSRSLPPLASRHHCWIYPPVPLFTDDWTWIETIPRVSPLSIRFFHFLQAVVCYFRKAGQKLFREITSVKQIAQLRNHKKNNNLTLPLADKNVYQKAAPTRERERKKWNINGLVSLQHQD